MIRYFRACPQDESLLEVWHSDGTVNNLDASDRQRLREVLAAWDQESPRPADRSAEGSRAEVGDFESRGAPVFYTIADLCDWLGREVDAGRG